MVEVRVLTIILIVLVAVGLLLEIVATATTSWYKNVTHFGLFKICPLAIACVDYDQPDYVNATAAFCILGILVAAAALILILLRMFVDSMSSNNIVRLLVLVLNWVAFGCYFLAIIIFGAKVKDNLNYSYALACVAMILQLAAAVLATMLHLRGGSAQE